jgi:hypothetical protein
MKRLLFAAAFAIFLTACGQDTPITPDDPASAIWSPPRFATPLAYRTLAPNETPIAVRKDDRIGAPLPDCTPHTQARPTLPQNFPADLPLPENMVLFKSLNLNNNPNAMQIVGYTPHSVSSSLRFLLDEFPKAGFPLGRGDSEQTEAESQFTGKGWIGAFWVREFFTCPGITEWVVIVVKR